METVLAITLFALAGLALVNLIPSSWLAVHAGQQRLDAANLAQSLLEERRAGNFDGPDFRTTLPATIYGGTQFTPTVEVATAAGQTRLKIVNVTVTWQTGRGTQSVVRQTMVCKVAR